MEIEITEKTLTLLGIVFGLLMISPIICSIISEAVKGKKDDEEDDLK